MKSEPDTYSIQQLAAQGVTNWDHVRNYQARNALRETQVGDQVLIYHSGKERAVVGVARVHSKPYPDPEPGDDTEWVQIDLKFDHLLKRPVGLAEIKADLELAAIPLIRQSRLSVMPIQKKEFEHIIKLSKQVLSK